MLGVYEGLSNEKYHKVEAVSNTYLGNLKSCPANAKTAKPNKYCFAEGQAMHMLNLEGEEAFNDSVVECSAGTFTAKAYQTAVDENPGKIILCRGGIALCRSCQRAIQMHPTASTFINSAGGQSEVSAFAVENTTNILCKVRPDHVNHAQGMYVDLKFVRAGNADAKKFGWEIRDRYARQAGWYTGVFNAAAHVEYDRFCFIVVEKEAPFRCEAYLLDGDYIDWGWGEAMRLLQIEAQCRKNNYWPNYTNAGAGEIYLPDYMREEN